MTIYVVGSSKNTFLPLDNIRTKFLIDKSHDGDNIDSLNPWYCELTGLYYLWKHCDDDIVGLEHYRRYFVNDRKELLSEKEIRNILKTYDVIAFYDDKYCPVNCTFFKTQKIFNLAEICGIETIKNNKLGTSLYTYCKTPGTYLFNMLICNKNTLNKICEQLFSILNDIKITHEIKRSHGYISEMLLGSLFKYNQLKIYNSKFRYIKGV